MASPSGDNTLEDSIMRFNATRAAALLSAVTIVGAAGCDELTSTTFAVSIISETPNIQDASGWDANLDTVIDASYVPAATLALVGVGERDGTFSTNVTSIADAAVTVSWTADAQSYSVALCGTATDGSYQASSVTGADCADASLAYVPNAAYTTEIETATDVHTLEVTAPEAMDPTYVAFSPAFTDAGLAPLTLDHHPLNTALTVDWSAAPNATEHDTFVTVVRVDFTEQTMTHATVLNSANWSVDSANPVFDNTPRDPAGMFDLLQSAPPTSAEIPATTFDRQGLYVVVVTPTELSDDTDNLMLGSAALAGKGTAFVFLVN